MSAFIARKIVVTVFLSLLSATGFLYGNYEFLIRNTEGKEVLVEVQSVNDSGAKVKLKSGKLYNLPKTKLDEDT